MCAVILHVGGVMDCPKCRNGFLMVCLAGLRCSYCGHFIDMKILNQLEDV